MYIIPFWTARKTAENLPAKAYHPLEYQSSFASPEFGIPKGGVSMIQLIRYHETPVGPYDELVFCPGSFEYPVEGKDGKKSTKKAMRVTRIYVSQKYTCWNGRKTWNLPKHLAHFDWTDHPDGTSEIKVFPHDHHPHGGEAAYDPTEARPGSTTKPFFQCTIRPVRLLPSLPVSSAWLRRLGFDFTLVQPPLPEGGRASQGELPGTEEWVALSDFQQSSRRCSLAWGDFAQDGEGEVEGGSAEFWPGLGRSGLVVKLDRGEADFGEGVRWPTPRALL
ncbi:hypothetical protein NEMBOFW57_002830 [Staphylotrichum longicolle]|uniref:Uncharacterized protein n=1 Tax=Staphylotrichum longicolle TaxID=669026 RepID=A0AAD4I243_9PEZI|nr:hypothetical protein NEMBOFW57_002830 [Staphylotrichum longicolle]